MIRSFADEAAEHLYHGISSKRALRIPVSLWPAARRRLDMLNAAVELRDLAAPPGNRLEKLGGSLAGCYSIRINDQFRVVFRWRGDGAYEVQITDYH